MMGATGLRRKFDDIFSPLDTIHEREGRTEGQTDEGTDGRTSDNSKDRADA